jgi:hypothetical protein
MILILNLAQWDLVHPPRCSLQAPESTAARTQSKTGSAETQYTRFSAGNDLASKNKQSRAQRTMNADPNTQFARPSVLMMLRPGCSS